MKIFFSVGEPSGDVHGANLIRAIHARRPDVECIGYGGPAMAAAGCRLHEDLTRLAVMWFLRALLHVHEFLRLYIRADRIFRDERPDAVVLIDYPGFNWWIARRAKRHGIPVVYYGTPQIWGWAQWRIKKLKRLVDHALCKLPFEPPWYRSHGVTATYVGHPYFDEVCRRTLDERFLADHAGDGPLVTILPGSRTQEVKHNLPWLLKTAAVVRKSVPNVRFAIAAYRNDHAETARKMAAEAGLVCDVHCQRTPELIHLADCTLAVSGSVSLELLYHAKPTVILYWISPLAFAVQKYFRKVKYITLVNLLATDELFPADLRPFDPRQPDAERVLFPEYLTCDDRTADMASHIIGWLTDSAKLAERVAALEQLRDQVAAAGASGNAADYILNALRASPEIPLRKSA